MYEYVFLFCIAIVWMVFASVQDIKTKEVSNWLNFSLVALGLAYRLFYSMDNGDYQFFISGVAGFFVFFALSQAFYYSRVFGGGDAKLLMGAGVVLPYSNIVDFAFQGSIFIVLLFFIGGIYSLIFSLFIALKNKAKFTKACLTLFKEINWKLYGLIFFLVFAIVTYGINLVYGFVFIFVFIFLALLFIYLMAVDKSCMYLYIKPKELREGDWIGEDIKINGRKIGKSVHGLSLPEIKLLIKRGKKVLIKQGVPFVPAFLISYIVMLLFFFSGQIFVLLFFRFFSLNFLFLLFFCRLYFFSYFFQIFF